MKKTAREILGMHEVRKSYQLREVNRIWIVEAMHDFAAQEVAEATRNPIIITEGNIDVDKIKKGDLIEDAIFGIMEVIILPDMPNNRLFAFKPQTKTSGSLTCGLSSPLLKIKRHWSFFKPLPQPTTT